MMRPTNITQLTIFSGNSGNAGTAQKQQSLQRSRYRNESGNKGTQLCLINRLPPPVCSRSKNGGNKLSACKARFRAVVPAIPRSHQFRIQTLEQGGMCCFC